MEIVESEKEKGVYEASIISEVRPDDGVIVLELDGGMEIELTRSIPEQMDELYDLAKKYEQKIINAKEAIAQSISELNKMKEKPIEVKKPEMIVKHQKEWYERFLWFHSSEGYLVISGKDAAQNETIVKRHIDADDLVFHTELHGSPFTIVKNGRDSGEKTKNEAAQQTVTYSKAWQENISADAYYVMPHQVTKQAPSGEYIQRGAFMIRGKKNYIKKLKPELAVGISEDFEVIAGPRPAVSKATPHYIVIAPGDVETGDIAKEIKQRIVARVPEAEKIPLEDFQRFVPGRSILVSR
jgi:hypothetical protein